jgi:diacylglycerol O-acyltransferase / wax synthase
MRRLDGLSTFLLQRETPASYQHTLKICFFDTSEVPGGWSFEKFRVAIAGSSHIAPIYRCKIMRVPFGLHRPVWVDDPEFDVDYHLRYVSCPSPGDNQALCALISQIYAYPLDPNKPLWLCWVIDGLPDGQIAMVTLLHHTYVDGTGAARLLERFFTHEPNDDQLEPAPWHPEPTPSKFRLILDALRDIPITLAESVPPFIRGMRELRKVRAENAATGKTPAPNPFRDSRDSPFNALLTHGRTFVFETFALSGIKSTSNGFGVSVNDLFLAVVADVYRQFMLERGYDADRGPLLATIPVERRPPLDEDDMIGNRTSGIWLWLPVHIADPIERIRYAHDASQMMKGHFQATEGTDPLSIMEITPLPLFLLPDWIVKRRKNAVGLYANAILSNVKGPPEPLYWGRMRMTNWISIGQVLHGMAINTTVWSYAGNFNLSIMADKKLLPDGWDMVERFRASFKQYAELAANQKLQL